MAVIRKIILFMLALAVGIGAYMGYRFFANPPAIPVGGGYTIVKSESPSVQLDDAQGEIGQAIIGQTEVSEFNLLDPEGNVKSRFGFEKLLHSEGNQWQLEKPYVNIFDDKYTCNVRADSGFIRIEMVAAKPVPVGARLNGNVVIEFKTTEGGRDCRINLETLNYDIERNSFESAGQVLFTADNMKMSGKGMSLKYNPLGNRIELLKIPALDYISITEQRLKLASDEKEAKPSTATHTQNDAKGVFYEFILDDNVKIKTENDSIAASSVRISNILWEESSATGYLSREPAEPISQSAQAEQLPRKSPDGFEYWQPESDLKVEKIPPQQPQPEFETVTTIYITCDGGLVFRPHTPTAENAERAIDLIGLPVVISSERFTAQSPYLWYGLDSSTLRLYSRGQDEVVLTAADGRASLQTQQSIFWDETKSLATIKGPGAIYAAADKQSRQTRLNFTDTIRAYMPGRKLQSVEVHGGFDADISGDNPVMVRSDRATVSFNPEGDISELELSGNVAVSSADGGVEANSVSVNFDQTKDGGTQPIRAVATGDARLIGFESEKTDRYMPVLSAGKIEYNFTEQIATASGSIALQFNIPSAEGKQNMPLTVRADENVIYSIGAGYIEFNKNVRGISRAELQNYSEQSTFECEKLLVYLAQSSDKDTPTLNRLILEGQKVVLENKRFTKEGLLSIVNLECAGFDYDAVSGIMTAAGEGNIKVNNRNVVGKIDKDEISFGGPCYALIENFSSLVFDTNKSIIEANGGGKMLHIGYVPIMPDGSVGTRRLIDAGKIRINLLTSLSGKTVISQITATNKVYYYEPDKYQLIGDSLNYDASTSIVRIDGTKSNPCVLNSTLVDYIEYNIKTGGIKSSLGGVSSIPIGD